MNERDIVAEIEMAGRLGYSLQITEAEALRVTVLLAEIERLQAVADAARALLDTSNGKTLYECRGDLRDALAALDAGKVSG